MSQADELMKGFSLGQQTSRWKPLGDAIRGTLARLQEREDIASQYATKFGMERIFSDPNERLLTQAKLAQAQAETEKTGLEMQGLREYFGSNVSGDESGERNYVSPFGRRPAKTPQEALSLIPEAQRGDYTVEVEYTKNPLGLEITSYKPVLTEEAKARQAKTGQLRGQEQVSAEVLSDELRRFLSYDDLIHTNRPSLEGKPFGEALSKRGAFGTKASIEGWSQATPMGRAVAQEENQMARLALKLVRSAGDVGNIRVDERKAQETLIPNKWDGKEMAETKRQYLTDLVTATMNKDTDTIRNILTSLGVTIEDIESESPTSPFNPQSALYKGNQGDRLAQLKALLAEED